MKTAYPGGAGTANFNRIEVCPGGTALGRDRDGLVFALQPGLVTLVTVGRHEKVRRFLGDL
jgi:hypothetical protein